MSQLQTRNDAANSVASLLQSEQMVRQLRLAVPKGGVTAERLARIVMTEVRRNPKLLQCSRESLLGAVMQCAQLGLEPGPMGYAWIIPYGREAQFQTGYKGLLALAWRSEQIKSVQADVVYKPDHFRFRKGLDPMLEHIPSEDPERLSTPRTHAWACVHTKSEGVIFDAISIEQIEAIRSRSKSPKSPAWVNDYDEMAKKSILRRVLKYAPSSTELQRAIALDEMAEVGMSQSLAVDVPELAANGNGEETETESPDARPLTDDQKELEMER